MFSNTFSKESFQTQALVDNSDLDFPINNGFGTWTAIGTLCGAMTAWLLLHDTVSFNSALVSAICYSSVGAISGWLVYGLYDVVFGGRLEIDANLPSDSLDSESNSNLASPSSDAVLSQENDAVLAKAS